MKDEAVIKKGLRFTAGVIGLQGFSYAFDYFLYPIMLLWLGVLKGTVVLFFLALVLNYIAILIYDKIKIDLFGFEELKKIKEEVTATGKKTFLQKAILLGDIPAFIVFSWYDPIFAVLYKRKSTQFDGFKRRDYWILILSTSIGCFIWSLMLGPLAYLVRISWQHIAPYVHLFH